MAGFKQIDAYAISPNAEMTWFTFGIPPTLNIVWQVKPKLYPNHPWATPRASITKVVVQLDRPNNTYTHFITVKSETSDAIIGYEVWGFIL
jgi:hypothetical protein